MAHKLSRPYQQLARATDPYFHTRSERNGKPNKKVEKDLTFSQAMLGAVYELFSDEFKTNRRLEMISTLARNEITRSISVTIDSRFSDRKYDIVSSVSFYENRAVFWTGSSRLASLDCSEEVTYADPEFCNKAVNWLRKLG